MGLEEDNSADDILPLPAPGMDDLMGPPPDDAAEDVSDLPRSDSDDALPPPLPDPDEGSDAASLAAEAEEVSGGSGSDFDVDIVMPEASPSDPAIAPAPVVRGPPGDPFIGRSFGGYQLVDIIGRGGMGSVYLGVQVSLDRKVAVKLLNKALVDNKEFIIRFQREARAMANIKHNNIVSVIDFGEQDGAWYMVAEFVDGTNLARMIREQLMVPADELVPIMIQCLSGLDHVSKQGIVHRDIKPDNILIDKQKIAKIADFGLAKDLSKDETELTMAGSAMGTPSYMSPEQCMGHKLDVRSDIYALGVTAYYALTGEKPFTGRSSFEIMTRQREYMPPDVAKINPRCPRPISELVMAMIAKSPKSRFASASECRDAWVSVGTELGYFGSVTVSGEFYWPEGGGQSGRPSAAVSYPDDDSPIVPNVEVGADLPNPDTDAFVPQDSAGMSDGLPAMGSAPPAMEAPPLPESQVGDGDGKPGSTRLVRPGASQRFSNGGSSPRGISCPKCGTLNRSTRVTCEKCDEPLHEDAANGTGIHTERLRHAERLHRQGRFEEAAKVYGQLADKESDRRQRSVLRTKEREARNRFEGNRVAELRQRIEECEQRGDLSGAVKLLKRGIADASDKQVAERLTEELRRVQHKRKGKRRLVMVFLLLVALAGGAVAAWVFRAELVQKIPQLEAVFGDVSQGEAPASTDTGNAAETGPGVSTEADAAVAPAEPAGEAAP